MSWTHGCCDGCWKERHPDGRQPIRMLERLQEMCCWCGENTWSGIYVREDPKMVNFP